MSGRNTYDISPQKKEIIEWKVAKRTELRNEYLRELHDPKRKDALLDPGVQRFYATRVQAEMLYRPTVRGLIPAALLIAAIYGTSVFLDKRKEEREQLYRTGQVSYVDRVFKYK